MNSTNDKGFMLPTDDCITALDEIKETAIVKVCLFTWSVNKPIVKILVYQE